MPVLTPGWTLLLSLWAMFAVRLGADQFASHSQCVWSLMDKPETSHSAMMVRNGYVFFAYPSGFCSTRSRSRSIPSLSGGVLHRTFFGDLVQVARILSQVRSGASYIAVERPSVQFAMQEIMSGMSTPTVTHWAKVHRLAQYMLQHPEEGRDHTNQRAPDVLEVLTDNDWAKHGSLCPAQSTGLASAC